MEDLHFVLMLFGSAGIILCLVFMAIFTKTEKKEQTPEILQKRHKLLMLFFALLFLLVGALVAALAFICDNYRMAWPGLLVVLLALLMMLSDFLKK